MNTPHVSKSEENLQLHVYDLAMSWRATASETGEALTLGEGLWQPGGFGPLPHIHPESDEAFYVIEGAFDFRVGDHTIRGDRGDFLFVPRGTLHSFSPVSDTPARALFLYTPGAAGVEKYFAELAAQSEEGPAEPQKIRTLMAKWGMIAPPA